MFAKDYLQRLKAMVDELEDHPDIEVENFELNGPAGDAEVAAAKAYGGLSDEMEEFFRECNGFKLAWKYTGEDQSLYGDPDHAYSVEGHIDIWRLKDIFKDHEGMMYFDEDDKFKPLHPLDFWVPEACAALYLDGSDEPEVYYHYCGEEMSTLKLSFRQYLEKLLKSRGFWYWHKSIAAPEYFNSYNPTSHSEDGFRGAMPKLFPDFSNKDFERIDGYGVEEDDEEEGSDGGEVTDAGEGEGGGLDLSNISVSFTTGGPPPKSKMLALALAFFLGIFGAHRFYLGKYLSGAALLFTFGGCGMWIWVDIILIALDKLTDADGRALE